MGRKLSECGQENCFWETERIGARTERFFKLVFKQNTKEQGLSQICIVNTVRYAIKQCCGARFFRLEPGPTFRI